MKKITILFFALLLFYGITACTAENNTINPIQTEVSVKEAGILIDAIMKGCKKSGWMPLQTGGNEIMATSQAKGYLINIKIYYGSNGYLINYQDSAKIKSGSGDIKIKPAKYNKLAKKLNKNITAAIKSAKKAEK